MSISKRVAEAIEKLEANDAEGALIPTCSALDATATAHYGKHGGKSYRDFIQENMELITRVSFGGRAIGSINLNYDVNRHRPPGVKPVTPGPGGVFSLQEIFYYVVRCCLLHGARLPPDLTFEPGYAFCVEPPNLVLPSELVIGFAVSVIGCPANAAERFDESKRKYLIKAVERVISLNDYWGKKEALLGLYAPPTS